MPLATTRQGSLHYEIVDQVAPWQRAARGDPVPSRHRRQRRDLGAAGSRRWPIAYRLVSFDMRGYGRSHIPAADFAWSLDLMVEDLFAVADAAGLQRFHLVGESIGGTVALAAALARPERIATLTVSNGAHLGASIQRVEAWRRQLDEGGVKAWSDAFMPDRFHDDALSPEQRAWFAAQQEKWPRESILNALGVLIGTDLSPRLRDIKLSDPAAASRRQPVHPGAGHGRAASAAARRGAQRDRAFAPWSALFPCQLVRIVVAGFSRLPQTG